MHTDLPRRTDFENLEVGEACIYHEGYLAIDREEIEDVLDENGHTIPNPGKRGYKTRRTRRALELDKVAIIAYKMSEIFILYEREGVGKDVIGTCELQLTQQLVKRQFGNRGYPIYQYIATRIKMPDNVIKISH